MSRLAKTIAIPAAEAAVAVALSRIIPAIASGLTIIACELDQRAAAAALRKYARV